MKNTKYICFEGTEGVGKTTQVQELVSYLISRGYSVLQTKEPGTAHSPLTMELRNIMLNNSYDAQLTTASRELISQAIRSIHLEKVIKPAMGKYDFIIQDRGVLSGLAYGRACGNELHELTFLSDMVSKVMHPKTQYDMYNAVIVLKGNVSNGLSRAQNAKQEFAAGDAMESKGTGFLSDASAYMSLYSTKFNNVLEINVDGKSIVEVFAEIRAKLEV